MLSVDLNRRTALAWINDPSESTSLLPGYTMAELCVYGLDDKQPPCKVIESTELLSSSEPNSRSKSTSGYSISGHVLTAEGNVLNDVTIVAIPERLNGDEISNVDKLRFWTVTDLLGAYSLDGLPDGEYTIRSVTQGEYQSARVTARTGAGNADLIVSRNTALVIEGQIVSAEGGPLEGVTVLPVLLGQASVLTDFEGRFRLPVRLKPDVSALTLRFQRPGFREESARIDLQLYGMIGDATLEVVMNPVESWTLVSGTVQSDSGDALAGRVVELRSGSVRQTYRTTTDRRGRYTFPAVESPADYQLIVLGGADHMDHKKALHVTGDIGQVDVVAKSYEFGAVSGHIVNLNGEPVPNFDLVLRNTASRKPNALVSTDESGNFKIPAVPAGALVVASQSTPSILVQGLELQPGDKLHLPLVLDWGPHEMRGVVVDADGNPVPASRIVLKWSHQAEGITTQATRRTASNMQGHFGFSNLGPGPHSLQIVAAGHPAVNIDHDLSRQGYDLTVRLN